jgi:hypothetical protein
VVPGGLHRVEDGREFVGGQDDGEPGPGGPGEGEGFDRPGSAEGDGVEELEGGEDRALGVVGALLDLDLGNA